MKLAVSFGTFFFFNRLVSITIIKNSQSTRLNKLPTEFLFNVLTSFQIRHASDIVDWKLSQVVFRNLSQR